MGQSWKTFMLHYNFPSYSVGEVRPNRGPGRREIGHGALAERSLTGVVPSNERFPYTIRIVSDILESNGSSSMASVCGASLALMDAGVPIKSPVAGIAMGLIQEGDRVAVLSDIRGVEDHLGDMDFKVAGTAEGITGIQMDIKIKGLDLEILRSALAQARAGPAAHPRGHEPDPAGVAVGDLEVRAAHHRGQHLAGQDPRHHRTGRQDDQEDLRADRRHHRRRGRRDGQGRLRRRRDGPAGRGDHPLPHRGSGDRPDLSRPGEADRQLRRLRRDPSGTRRSGPHLRAGEPPGGPGRGRREGRRRRLREGHRGRRGGQDPALAPGRPAGDRPRRSEAASR